MPIQRDLYDKVNKKMSESEKILICLNNRSSFDTHVAFLALLQYLQSQDKNVSVCVNGPLASKPKRLFEENNIELLTELKPLRYVISIDHTDGGIEKVSYDDQDGKFQLFITPAEDGAEFDFDSVSFSQGGDGYGLILVFGARSLNWLGNIYQENKPVFEAIDIVNINSMSGNQEFGNFKLVDSEIPVSEIVFELMNGDSSAFSEKIANLLMLGVLDDLQLFHKSEYKISTVDIVSKLAKAGADIKTATSKLYLSKSLPNFRLSQGVMDNLKFDRDAGVAWSGVNAFDVSQSGVNRNNFEINGRIIFNMSEEIKVAFVTYEVSDNEVWVELESNLEDISARHIAGNFSPSGNDSRVVWVTKGKSMIQVEDEIIAEIKEKMNLSKLSDTGELTQASTPQPDVSVDSPDVDAQNQELTQNNNEGNNNGDLISQDIESQEGLVVPPPVSAS